MVSIRKATSYRISCEYFMVYHNSNLDTFGWFYMNRRERAGGVFLLIYDYVKRNLYFTFFLIRLSCYLVLVFLTIYDPVCVIDEYCRTCVKIFITITLIQKNYTRIDKNCIILVELKSIQIINLQILSMGNKSYYRHR